MPITPEALLVDSWGPDLSEYSDMDGIINYSIEASPGSFSPRNLGVSPAEDRFIRKTLRKIDNLTGLAFSETNTEQADIVFFSVESYKNPGVVGLTRNTGSQMVVTWKDYGGDVLTRYEKSVIRHETGHALGLSHPYGDGWYAGASTLDTIMSYNEANYIVTKYSQSDISALQMMWGTPISLA